MSRAVQVVAVTGGKGGVGKTTLAVNTAIALAEAGQRVAILDADFGLANVDVMLDLRPGATIEDVLDGRAELRDIVRLGPAGVRVIPGASGTRRLTKLSELEHSSLVSAFDAIADQLDILLVDTAAGIGDQVVNFANASREVLVVLCNDPSSFADAYALIKVLWRDFGRQRFRVVANMVASEQEGQELVDKLDAVCQQFLPVSLLYAGTVPMDEALREAVRQQQPVLLQSPGSASAVAIRKLAETVATWPVSTRSRGQLEFFVDQLLAG